MMTTFTDATTHSIGLLLTKLPGPDRKRSPSLYRFHITYRAPDDQEPGCVMTWAVTGGRETYQIALEREESGQLRWHCTCADAVYRSELSEVHQCKHVRGLMECCPPIEEPLAA